MKREKVTVQAIPLYGHEYTVYAQVTDEWLEAMTIINSTPGITLGDIEDLCALGVVLRKWERDGDKLSFRRSTTIVGINAQNGQEAGQT